MDIFLIKTLPAVIVLFLILRWAGPQGRKDIAYKLKGYLLPAAFGALLMLLLGLNILVRVAQ